MAYGLQIEKSRKPTWELQKPMGYGGVCIIPGMCYVGVDCSVLSNFSLAYRVRLATSQVPGATSFRKVWSPD
jgi:hypothetical protein